MMTIEERLENMERELGRLKRRNRWLLGAILLVAGGLIAPGVFEITATRARSQEAGTAKEIRASRFVLEDAKGKTLAALALEEFGPGLALFDENGTPRAGLWADKDGPSLSLFDENGKNRAGLWASKDGPRLALSDENGKNRFMAGKTKTATPDGKIIEYPESSLILFGPDGKVIWSAIKYKRTP